LSTAPISDNPTPQASKIALPEGTITVGIGLFIAGISAYIFFKMASNQSSRCGLLRLH
jgi:hypothetical protein